MQLPSSQCLHAAYIYGTVMGNEEIHNVALARSLSEEVNRFVRSLVANICKRTKERVRSLSPEGENCVPGFHFFSSLQIEAYSAGKEEGVKRTIE